MKLKLPPLTQPLKHLMATSHYRQLSAWGVAIGLGVVVSTIGRRNLIETQTIGQLAWLFIINSAVFLAIYRDYPKLGVVMLVFIYFLLLAVLGYFLLLPASFSA